MADNTTLWIVIGVVVAVLVLGALAWPPATSATRNCTARPSASAAKSKRNPRR